MKRYSYIISLLVFFFGIPGLYSQTDLNPPINFHKELDCSYVTMSWNSPLQDTSLIQGYNIYIEDTLFATISNTSFGFKLEMGDSISFAVSTLYINGESKKVKSTIEIPHYYSSSALDGFIYPDNQCCFNVRWTPPPNWDKNKWPILEDYLSWCTDEFSSRTFLGNEVSFAARWTSTHLSPYHGTILEQIAFYPISNEQEYSIQIYEGDSAESLLHDQDVIDVTQGEWNYINLDTLIFIDSTKELWAGYTIQNQTGNLNYALDEGPAVAGYGDWTSYDSEWLTFSSFGMDYNNPIQIITHKSPWDSIPFFHIDEYFWGMHWNEFIYNDTILEDCIIGYSSKNNELEVIVETRYLNCIFQSESILFNTNCQLQSQKENSEELPISILIKQGNIQFKNNSPIRSIQIYNLMGQLVDGVRINNTEYILNTNQLNHGLYILHIRTDDKLITRKAII